MMTLRDKLIFTVGFIALIVMAVGAFIGIYGHIEMGMVISISSLLCAPVMLIVDFIFEERESDE